MTDEYFKLLDRMVKGAELIESTEDPKKRAYYRRVYDEMERQLNEIKSGRKGIA